MLKNHIKIALRNLIRHKQTTLINIMGLAVGMAACILILLFVQHELSYDRYHENADRIYRISREWHNEDGETNLHLGHLAPPFAPMLANDFPEAIEQAVRMVRDDRGVALAYEEGDVLMEEDQLFFAEPSIFQVFSFPLVQGDPKTALTAPNSIVLTESAAQRYFGDQDPLGKVLTYANTLDLKVTGITADVPANTHFHFDMLVSFATLENYLGKEEMTANWASNYMSTYLLLAEGYDPQTLASRFPDFMDRHIALSADGTPASEVDFLHLWPLADIHLYSHLDSEIEDNGSISYIYLYTIIAFFLILIACINFINLSTARAGRRAKEVGVRKVMGAARSSLIRQFLSESVLIALFSLMAALLLVELTLPFFNVFVGQQLSVSILENTFVAVLLFTIVLVVGVVAGSYPAFFLSSFLPARILKSGFVPRSKHANFRSGLVVLQFTISIILIIGVFTIEKQLDYVKNKPLGFNRENLLVLPVNETINQQYEQLKARLVRQPGISDVTLSSRVPSGSLLDAQRGNAEVYGEIKNINFRLAEVHVDHDFLNAFQLALIAGRDFDIDRSSDSTEAFILNETAVRRIGWTSPEDAVGKKINYGMRQGYVIGVVQDFHFESLHQPISPIVFQITTGLRPHRLVVRLDDTANDEALGYLKEQWDYLMPGFPFNFYTVSERFDKQYTKEDKLSQVVLLFSGLALFIAALGLIGMASFVAEQRTKEVGIRKVMGASVSQILLLLTRGFSKLVLIAFLLACPLAYFLMSRWLTNFAYYDTLGIGIFLMAGTIALLVAWITVGSQTVRAAIRNPVESLRDE
ncbi:ABC transporter permease [Catalinimonas niigatensis]|uniref:ABC transporter permease n=1 Tax=Catalinimonas niigatensis TaxID=1397264 RepID=UPI0026664E9A|nr:ABC transporter permease [Catalinimonas niigatensis]WPP48466.1 ABC transporter permease [Catalinimonas niigatensis]